MNGKKAAENVSDAGISASEETVRDRRQQYVKTLIPIAVCILGVGILLFVTYGWAYINGWKLSFTNLSYSFLPFSTSGVQTSGPLLSDPADNVLPIAWYTFHPLTFTAWLSDFALGSPQLMSLYLSPLNYFYLLPYDIAQILISVVKVLVAFISMFLFVRRIGCTWRGAFIAGASYSLCAVMVMWNGWPHSEVTMYAPLLFLLMDMALERLSVWVFAGVAVVVYLMLVAGMPTYAAYFFYVLGIYVLFYGIRTHRHNPRKLATYFIFFACAVVLGGVMSLPYTGQLLGSVSASGYADSRSGQASTSLDISRIKTLLFPYLPTSYSIHMNEGTLYAGVLAIVSLPLTIFNIRKKKRVIFFAVLAIVAGLLIFTPALDIVFTHLPLINTSLKFRVIVVLDFALSVLVGINIDDLLTRKKSKQQRIALAVIAVLTGLIYSLIVLYVKPLFIEAEYYAVRQVYVASVVVILYVVVLCACAITLNRFVSLSCSCALVFGVSVDMGYFAKQYIPLIEQDAAAVPEATDSITYLQENTESQEKIVTLGSWTLYPMTNIYYGLRNILGHGFVHTNEDMANYYEIISAENNGSSTRPNYSSIDNVNLLKYMGVKYIVGSEEMIIDNNMYLGSLRIGDDGLAIVELDEYASQIEIVDTVKVLSSDDDVLKAMSESYKSNTIFLCEDDITNVNTEQSPLSDDESITQVEESRDGIISFVANTDQDRYILINEYNDGNWVAYVDGEKTEVITANYMFRAIEVPEGTHTIELKYESTSLNVMFIAAGAGGIILVALLVLRKRINKALDDVYATSE